MDTDGYFSEIPNLSGRVTLQSRRRVFESQYSSVYQGKLADELVAVKVLKQIHGADLGTMQRKIKRERSVWARLRHTNILPLYGFADDHEDFYPFGAFISPWREQGNACEFMKSKGRNMTPSQRFDLWAGVVAGVDHLHSHTPVLVHGDLKSANVLIDNNNVPQICDFGLISILLEQGNSGMTTTSAYTGTDRYLAYELVLGGETVAPTTASDIFALGCIGLEICLLQQPYAHRKNNMRGQIFIDIRAGIPPATRPQPFDVQNEGFWIILDQCWSRMPRDRTNTQALMASLPPIRSAVTEEPTSFPGASQIDVYLLSSEAYQEERLNDLQNMLDDQDRAIEDSRANDKGQDVQKLMAQRDKIWGFKMALMQRRQTRRIIGGSRAASMDSGLAASTAAQDSGNTFDAQTESLTHDQPIPLLSSRRAASRFRSRDLSSAAAGFSSYTARPIRDPSTCFAHTFDQELTDDAVRSSAIATPGSLPTHEQDKDAANGGKSHGSEGISLLTKSLQMFSESPPEASIGFYQRQFGRPKSATLAGPHVTLSQPVKNHGVTLDPSARRHSIHQQLEEQTQRVSAAFLQQQWQQQQSSHKEFIPSSLPVYSQYAQEEIGYLTGDQRQALAPNYGFPRRVRKTSFDHTVRLDDAQYDVRAGGRHQVNGSPMPPPTETTPGKSWLDTPHDNTMLQANQPLSAGPIQQSPLAYPSNPTRFDSQHPQSEQAAPFPSSSFNFALSGSQVGYDSASYSYPKGGIPDLGFPQDYAFHRTSTTDPFDFLYPHSDGRPRTGPPDDNTAIMDHYALRGDEEGIAPTVKIASAAAAAAISESVERVNSSSRSGFMSFSPFDDAYDSYGEGMGTGMRIAGMNSDMFFPSGSYAGEPGNHSIFHAARFGGTHGGPASAYTDGIQPRGRVISESLGRTNEIPSG